MGYSVRPASAEDVAVLPAIERAAAERFEGYPFAGRLGQLVQSRSALARAQREGRLWTAVYDADDGSGCPQAVVGFALGGVIDDHAHVEEVDVLPDHGRRGLGRLLVEAVCDWARRRGDGVVTLSTLSYVPWNAPFYARLGFRVVAEDELSAALRALLEQEWAAGLPVDGRVVMSREP